MLEDERILIINELGIVDKVILSIDKDRSVCATLEKIFKEYSDKYDLFFANGGDQNTKSSPETPLCQKVGIGIIDGLGDKVQSSSWLLKKNENK